MIVTVDRTDIVWYGVITRTSGVTELLRTGSPWRFWESERNSQKRTQYHSALVAAPRCVFGTQKDAHIHFIK